VVAKLILPAEALADLAQMPAADIHVPKALASLSPNALANWGGANMKITKVAPPINGGAIWSGEAVSDRQHYFWMADQGGKGCQAQSGRLKERGHVSRNGVRYSRFKKVTS
jgi:hypothetical protein